MKKIASYIVLMGALVALSGCGKPNKDAGQTKGQKEAVESESKSNTTSDKKVLILHGYHVQLSRSFGSIRKSE